MKTVYEIVDTSDPESYYTLGLFEDYWEARNLVEKGPEHIPTPSDCDSLVIEIRPRVVGRFCYIVSACISYSWEYRYNEQEDEMEWIRLN